MVYKVASMEVVTRIVVRCWTSKLTTAGLEHIDVARCPLRELLGLLLGHLGYVDTTVVSSIR